mmetsp:Transcript_18107/g.37651  ORF Transcript_18107/g.37651 Transcript_18107/m.37651 type:complete len:1061 (-) Transcript_18107:457-3639(-)|eukprot:CAMPEP_0184689272 /NCGR_PEP_ID=MMETSP0312-20130426/30561_1 /TAXON_ID=31354 /ORGANISM="Compsopogon coeruleus, Strain SAG 36.94" /LENGTH=1060 /DNA_ID=CAMNT_0027146603 /DNA_START=124 /DNA_END=3306 /DNA_ORIENTATION=+
MEDVEEGRGGVGRGYGTTQEELIRVIEDRDLAWVQGHDGVAGVAKLLNVSVDMGISASEIKAGGEGIEKDGLGPRRIALGENRFKYPPPKSFLLLMFNACKDLTIMILTVAAVVSLIIGLAVEEKRKEYGYIEGLAIVFVIVVVVMVSTCIDYSKERKFRQLNSVKDNYDVVVLRAGDFISVKAEEICVGDVVKVSMGDKMPADAILIEGSNLKTNESAMTGEVVDISKKPEKDPFLLSGTSVSEGVGTCLVVAVGERSQWGLILSQLQVEPQDTPLQERLETLAKNIGYVGITMAVLIFLVSIIRWIVDSKRSGHWDGNEVLLAFINSITIIVVAIPEGLPLAITLGLAFAMRKMMGDNNLVRRLEACETMGSATQLNADKTGTLTQNKMTVVQAYCGGKTFTYKGAGEDVEKSSTSIGDDQLPREFKEFLAINIAVNSQANLELKQDGTIEQLGNKTECALLQLVQSWGLDYRQLRASHKPSKVYLFDSRKKRMSSTESLGRGRERLHTKGAPEIVVKLCNTQRTLDGTIAPMGDNERQLVIDAVNSMASRGLRTLLMCYRDVEHAIEDEEFWEVAPEENLTFLAVCGIKDPIRPETKEAVRLLKGAGVTVRMVTGDNPLTARFIAQEAGILEPNDPPDCLLEGPVFRKMSPERKREVALKIRVLARSTPSDKLVLVREHQNLGEVVSVTGDGTNDAPALKEADVGFALGIAGTEIAKEACDIVILDDNIQSMAKAVLWGRNVYESIRKFLQFQLVVNVVAVTLNFLSACTGRDLPLGAVPLLWVNMIMDSMGALALATEPPRPELMDRKPFGRRAPLINRAMWRNIVGMSIYQLTVCLVLQYAGSSILNIMESEEQHRQVPSIEINSVIFNTFVFMQIFGEINARRIAERNIFSRILRSPYFLGIIAVTIVVQVVVIFLVGGTNVGNSIGIGSLSGTEWAISVVLGILSLPVGFLVRLFPLDWCFGAEDQDVTQMSKLEQLLRLPKRREPEFEVKDHDEGEDELPSSSKVVSPKDQEHVMDGVMRLRVFVHAIAFVNVVSKIPRPSVEIEYPSKSVE